MARYIDADELKSTLKNLPQWGGEVLLLSVLNTVDRQFTADVVEVVRCKDCEHCVLTEDGKYNPEDIVCDYFMTDGMDANDFCSHGKRKEVEYDLQRKIED